VTHNAYPPPIAATTKPAAAGPTVEADRSSAPANPVPRSSGTRAARVTSGINTPFAAFAGPSAAPTTATRASSPHSGSPPVRYSIGTVAMAQAATRSPVMLTRRGPNRSISGPASACTTTYGPISASTTAPVCSSLPVVVSTNHGSATAENRVPVQATACAPSSPTSPRSER
jgi:hypothetical protein